MRGKYSWIGAVIGAVFGLILAYLVIVLYLDSETILKVNLTLISVVNLIVVICFCILAFVVLGYALEMPIFGFLLALLGIGILFLGAYLADILSKNPLGASPLPIYLLIALPFSILGYFIGPSIEGWVKQRREHRQKIRYYKSKIKTWKEEGYNILELEELKNLDLVEEKIRGYESRIQRLKEIERELNSLNTQGFEKEVQSIRSKLKDPEKAELAEKEFLELKRNIEKSERMKEEIIAMIDEAILG